MNHLTTVNLSGSWQARVQNFRLSKEWMWLLIYTCVFDEGNLVVTCLILGMQIVSEKEKANPRS